MSGQWLTVEQVRRRRCFRCRRQGCAVWTCCADGNRLRVVCLQCDIALNRLVLRWMRDPRAHQKMVAYIALRHGQSEPRMDTSPRDLYRKVSTQTRRRRASGVAA